jgi:hypothetical protein
MKQIEQHINSFLIPDLINYNFGSGVYPRFEFEDLSDETRSIMKSAFDAILKRSDLPTAVVEGIAKELAVELSLDENIDVTASKDEKAANLSEKQASRQYAETKYGRALTPAEERVNLTELERRIDTSVDRLYNEASALFAADQG